MAEAHAEWQGGQLFMEMNTIAYMPSSRTAAKKKLADVHIGNLSFTIVLDSESWLWGCE